MWCSGANVLWCSDCSGCIGCSGVVVAEVQWLQWCSGAVVQWCSGAVIAVVAVVQWCSGTVVQWHLLSRVPTLLNEQHRETVLQVSLFGFVK